MSYLGLPEYEYADAENYDYLLPNHLTYGKGQIVKLHNAKLMSCENWYCIPLCYFGFLYCFAWNIFSNFQRNKIEK